LSTSLIFLKKVTAECDLGPPIFPGFLLMCSGANGKRDLHLAISLHTQANIHTERALI